MKMNSNNSKLDRPTKNSTKPSVEESEAQGSDAQKSEAQKSSKKSKFSPEEKELQKFHKDIRNKRRNLQKLTFDFSVFRDLSKQYRKLIDQKINFFKHELSKYFLEHRKPIFAYDIEEQHKKIVCFCGIELYPDLTYRLYFKINKNIFRRKNFRNTLDPLIRKDFEHINAKTVIAHGSNKKEQNFAQEAGKTLENTEVFAAAAMNTKNNAYKLGGSSLAHFEAKIGYERSACAFFKHDWVWFSSFNAMEWSFRNFLLNEDQRICIDCHKKQDVILYCLEDALVSLFINCWYFNHRKDIENEEKAKTHT